MLDKRLVRAQVVNPNSLREKIQHVSWWTSYPKRHVHQDTCWKSDQFHVGIYIHDKDVAGEIASDLFTPFHADTPGGERFLQALNSRFLCFAPIS